MKEITIVNQELDLKTLVNKVRGGFKPKLRLFYGHYKKSCVTDSCFSQWYLEDFIIDGVKYSCMEQYMMQQKALLFGDTVVADKIMNATEQRDFKRLGRQAKGFDQALWNKYKYSIVYNGNYHKFTQNKALLDHLLSTEDAILVEASPYDDIWGIKMSKDDVLSTNPLYWKG